MKKSSSTYRVGDRFNPYKEFVGAWIPNWLLRRDEISANAKLVYARLAQYGGKDGECFPLQETIASETGLSEYQVCRAIGQLKRVKLIDSVQRGLHKPNMYHFLIHEWNVHERKSGKKDS